ICAGLIERSRRSARGWPASREQLRRALEDLALTLVRGGAEGVGEREPADLLHLEVVIVHVAAGLPQQEEVHDLRDADALPDVVARGLPERLLQLGLQAGLLPRLADGGGLGRLPL